MLKLKNLKPLLGFCHISQVSESKSGSDIVLDKSFEYCLSSAHLAVSCFITAYCLLGFLASLFQLFT